MKMKNKFTKRNSQPKEQQRIETAVYDKSYPKE